MEKKFDSLAERKYEILKPYFSKDKTLKEISEENEISYSTLKRWLSSYKKQGIDGLKKNERKDKNTYRSVDEETMEYIKNLYEKEPNLKIFDYYKKISFFLKKIGEKSISYDTIYRIINELDPFITKYANKSFDKAKSKNSTFRFEYSIIDIEILDEKDDCLKKPYLNIVYDVFTKEISSYSISFNKINFDEILILLREALIKNNILLSNEQDKQIDFVINNIKFSEKQRIIEIYKKLKIQINCILNTKNLLNAFFNDFNQFYLKDLISLNTIEISMNKLNMLVEKYINKIYNTDSKKKFNDFFEKPLAFEKFQNYNMLLTEYKSKRKVLNGEIRFQNLYYTHSLLESFEKKELTIRYNPYDLSCVFAYYKNNYIAYLKNDIIEDYSLSLYEFLAIKKAIKVKYLHKSLSMKAFLEEFKYLFESKKNESI